MTKSLAQIQKQIAALEQRAEALKRKEAVGVIARIKDAIAHYGLTAADLGLVRRGRPPAKKKAAAGKRTGRKPRGAARKGAIKYRNDEGRAWTGHGRRPQWFIDALAAGKKPEDMLA